MALDPTVYTGNVVKSIQRCQLTAYPFAAARLPAEKAEKRPGCGAKD